MTVKRLSVVPVTTGTHPAPRRPGFPPARERRLCKGLRTRESIPDRATMTPGAVRHPGRPNQVGNPGTLVAFAVAALLAVGACSSRLRSGRVPSRADDGRDRQRRAASHRHAATAAGPTPTAVLAAAAPTPTSAPTPPTARRRAVHLSRRRRARLLPSRPRADEHGYASGDPDATRTARLRLSPRRHPPRHPAGRACRVLQRGRIFGRARLTSISRVRASPTETLSPPAPECCSYSRRGAPRHSGCSGCGSPST